MDKWVATRDLEKYEIWKVALMQLEENGLISVNDQKEKVKVLKLTLKSYHHFKLVRLGGKSIKMKFKRHQIENDLVYGKGLSRKDADELLLSLWHQL